MHHNELNSFKSSSSDLEYLCVPEKSFTNMMLKSSLSVLHYISRIFQGFHSQSISSKHVPYLF
jgi:hypothetical protein